MIRLHVVNPLDVFTAGSNCTKPRKCAALNRGGLVTVVRAEVRHADGVANVVDRREQACLPVNALVDRSQRGRESARVKNIFQIATESKLHQFVLLCAAEQSERLVCTWFARK